ncbi:radical SAM protein [Caulobacter sp. NIBR1757]|uniref:radical SAM protein n=1 Tax=Caulobacter sp. NIBR1757 TaxID=3016000 RepID=UPI0022F068EF|nr:radical SAM protein [Caulobacter sp. NIBR1757]
MDNGLIGGFSPHQIVGAVTNRRFELILLPTEKCNLRCTYCYEDFAIGRMSDETQSAIEQLLARRVPDLQHLNFSWFGGEPLVAKDVVLRLSRFAAELCKRHGVRFSGGLTTNAVQLTPELMVHLLDCNQNFFQITLDGWGATHDAVRKYANGRGSFDAIWRNLRAIKALEREFEIVLRVHVRRENIADLDELMRQVGEEFSGDERFRLDFQHLRDLGGTGGKTIQRPVTMSELFELETHFRRVFAEATPRARQNGDAQSSVSMEAFATRLSSESAGSRRSEEMAEGGGYICYAAKPNSLLVRADGRLAKCTVAFDDDRNTIGKINPDGTLTIDNEKLAPWVRGFIDLDAGSLACPLQSMHLVAPRTRATASQQNA